MLDDDLTSTPFRRAIDPMSAFKLKPAKNEEV